MRRLREMAMGYQGVTDMLVWQQSFKLLVPKFREKSTKNILVKSARDIIEELNPLIHSLSQGGFLWRNLSLSLFLRPVRTNRLNNYK